MGRGAAVARKIDEEQAIVGLEVLDLR